jgi:hypothetical protein
MRKNVFIGKYKEKYKLEVLSMNERKILKYLLNKYDQRVHRGLLLIRIMTSGELL